MSQNKDKLDALVAKREKVFSRVQTLFDLSKNLTKENFATFKARYEKIEDHYSDFDRIQDEISAFSIKVDPSEAVETKQSSASFEEIFYAVKAVGAAHIKTIQQVAAATNPSTPTAKAKLPDITIPTFNGDIKYWSNFYALFDSLIHKNISLPDVEKLQFLRTYVKGPALSMIEHLPLNDDNYRIAYNALLDRYQNKRFLASYYLSQMNGFKPLLNDHLNGLNHYLDVFKTNFAALEALKIDNLADFLFLHTALKALDFQTRKLFEAKYSSSDVPTFMDLMDFVQSQCKISELNKIQTSTVKLNTQPSNKPSKTFPPPKYALMSSSSQIKNDNIQKFVKVLSTCPMCKQSHKIQHCEEFIAKGPGERHALIKSWKRCFNCLGNHLITACTSTSHCKTCQRSSHHTLLHFLSPKGEKPSEPGENLTSGADKSIPLTSSLSCNMLNQAKRGHTVLLGTAEALIQDFMGHYQSIRLVIDPGSQVSCITSSCVQRLGLKPSKSNLVLTGIGNISSTMSKGSIHCILTSKINRATCVSAHAVILKQISADLPSAPISQKVYDRFNHLKLADPSFHRMSKIDFLLGADLYPEILSEDTPPLKGEPCAISTHFGWVIIGRAPVEVTEVGSTSLFVSSPSLDTLVKRFWEIEEVIKPHHISPEDIFCESYFQKTISRDQSGRYVVSYPFKESPKVLGSSRQSALKRLHKLEFRLENNLNLRKKYHEFLFQYEDMDHMSIAKSESDYIIPHHGVISKSSSDAKLRVVFDGSTKGSQGLSLNDILMKGPKLQQDISDIILNFRLKPIALVADCKMMYRMILIDESQRKYQHIFWRSDLSSPINEYDLNTVTYGLTSSPFLAQRVLLQLVTDQGENYPEAAKTVISNMYVDDIVTCVSTEDEALELKNQLIKLFNSGGFSLRKWASNSTKLLATLSMDTLKTSLLLDSEQEYTMKILGLEWDPHSDHFRYTVVIPTQSSDTKRTILSQIARIFDPLGWLSPTVFLAKHLMQLLWQSQVGWDDPVPDEIHTRWQTFQAQLPELTSLRIPRHPSSMKSYIFTLVGFSDASEKGYGAVTYLLSNSDIGIPSIMLLKAKSKVAPIKPQSIPRLELCGALLLARLIKSMQDFILNANILTIYLFTDSTTVLAWLNTPPHLLKVFVANRVVEILEDTSLSSWHHVSTHNNPADFSSRGLYPSDLLHSKMWWSGPDFLALPISKWPISQQITNLDDQLPELKHTTVAVNLNMSSRNPLVNLMESFSTLSRLQRVLAYVVRFTRNIKKCNTEDPQRGPLSAQELKHSLNLLVRLTQDEYFDVDKVHLSKKQLPSQAIRKLSPFLDNDGLLRVGGRLRYSKLPIASKHPLLLPKKCHLSKLICDSYHLLSLHGGPRIVQALIQKQFWILSLRSLLRQRIFRCLKCYKFNAPKNQPIMADLPPSRFSNVRPFLNVGLDMAGPFIVKESHRRNAKSNKAYLCLFICMSTKALHLELSSDLSTPAFLAALDRFVGRRGLPSQIYSDCGTNFQGAANHLTQVYTFLKKEGKTISENCNQRSIQWNFNPPAAPNFGGLWEAGVKSVKHHLKRCIGDKPLTFEELTTLLVRIEAVLNSRPLCPISNDPHDDTDYLTPGHFLIGSNILTPPEIDVTSIPQNRLSRWQILKQLLQSFWKIWSKEYLHTLIERPKWTKEVQNIAIGDVVYLKGQTTSPLNWPLARVEDVFPSRDGIVRVAKIRTSGGTLIRPVNKLVPLPYA